MGEPPPIDVDGEARSVPPPAIREVSIYSLEWAKMVKPFTLFVLWLITAVMMVPFLMILWFEAERDLIEPILQWSSTILPPVVGFGSAIMGYYFGTRSQVSKEESEVGDSG